MPPPHYAITMCNDLIFICYHLHVYPFILSHTIIYCTAVYTIIFQLLLLLLFYLFIYYIFLFSSYFYCLCRCCLCELEAYDTKINSLYAQAYLAIKALSDSDSEESV